MPQHWDDQRYYQSWYYLWSWLWVNGLCNDELGWQRDKSTVRQRAIDRKRKEKKGKQMDIGIFSINKEWQVKTMNRVYWHISFTHGKLSSSDDNL